MCPEQARLGMADRLTDEQVDEFLRAADPDVAAIARAVRAKLLEVFRALAARRTEAGT